MHHPLDSLFAPQSLIVVGGSERPGSVGRVLLQNLKDGGYAGELFIVNRSYTQVFGQVCRARVRDVGRSADLALLAVPASEVGHVLDDCAAIGVSNVVVLAGGFAETGEQGAQLQRELATSAREHHIRMLGPNCVGLARPSAHLQAFFGSTLARPGRLALISQSGAVCTAIVDWAAERGIGFSLVASIGAAADVGAGDVLDYLAIDPETDAVLLYIEGVDHPRALMSGLRAAARMKPVVVLKAGRRSEGARAARSHTAALLGSDAAFDCALRRAGAVRAANIEQLFAAAQLLASGKRSRGKQLAIVSNAGALGVMAADRAGDHGLPLAPLSPTTLEALNQVLPPHWSHANPIDLVGDATPERYARALTPILNDRGVDGIVVMLTPQAMTQPEEVARRIVSASQCSPKPVLTCFMGGASVAAARAVLTQHALPEMATPELAVDAFESLASFAHNQQQLLEVPTATATLPQPEIERAREIIRNALAEGRNSLGLSEAKALLQAFHIPVTPSERVSSADAAWSAAQRLGLPVALKIDSPDISHKTEVGGVRLGLGSELAVRDAFREILESARRLRPEAHVAYISVEPMRAIADGRELSAGIARDAAFGPVIAFGAGGTLVELIADQSLALPPLNRTLATEMIARARVHTLLSAYRGRPAADQQAIESVLLRLSELASELAQVRELDINPLIAGPGGALALDARVFLAPEATPTTDRYAHMAIEPFPAELVQTVHLNTGFVVDVRPIRPEDAALEQTFIRELSPESRYFRFHGGLRKLTPAALVRLTQIDYDREMAFVALTQSDAEMRLVGVGRYIREPDAVSCEFALVVADDWQGRGVGSALMRALIERARDKGLSCMRGEVLASNARMLRFCRKLGFDVQPHPEDHTLCNAIYALVPWPESERAS